MFGFDSEKVKALKLKNAILDKTLTRVTKERNEAVTQKESIENQLNEAKQKDFIPELLSKMESTGTVNASKNFYITPQEHGNGYVVYTGFCSLCACDIAGYIFTTKEAATFYSALCDAAGRKKHLEVCPECRKEYMENCI